MVSGSREENGDALDWPGGRERHRGPVDQGVRIVGRGGDRPAGECRSFRDTERVVASVARDLQQAIRERDTDVAEEGAVLEAFQPDRPPGPVLGLPGGESPGAEAECKSPGEP